MSMESVLKSPHLLLKLSMPQVMLNLMREAVKPQPDFNSLAGIISMDPVLAATVLSLVNSPFYGLTQKVTDLKRATVVLGSREVLKIAFSVAYQKEIQTRRDSCGFQGFEDWRLVVWSSVAAQMIAERICPDQADQAYLCALLKDVSLLLVQCASPDDLPPSLDLRCITALVPGQLEEEEEAWGMSHGALSQLLLTQWGLPGEFSQAMRTHHGLDELDRQSPLQQAVTLATRWAELELGHASGPFSIIRFEHLLRTVLGAGPTEVEDMRAVCITRFRSMLSTLGMEESGREEGYYRHTLSAMQTSYLLSMDLMTAKGGLPEVARTVGRHLRMHWDVQEWELALRLPGGRGYRLFECTDKDGVREGEFFRDLAEVRWARERAGLRLESEGNVWGELRLGGRKPSDQALEGLRLYLRFTSQAYEHYCARQAVLEEKAGVFDELPLAVAWLGPGGEARQCNPAMAQLLGTQDCSPDRTVEDLLRQGHGVELGEEWRRFLKDPAIGGFSRLLCFETPDSPGESGCQYISARRSSDGTSILFLMDRLDRLSDLELTAVRQLGFLESLLGAMRDLVLTTDEQGNIRFASDKRFEGRNLFRLAKLGEHHAVHWEPRLLAEHRDPLEADLLLPEGERRPVEFMFSRLGKRGEGSEYLVVARDLTRVRRLEKKLKRQALFDGLTGLYNHYQMHLILEREVQRSRRTGHGLGLMFFDLDGFKEINDTQGHQAGDAILKLVGKELGAKVRKGLDYPCRYGGDEFAVVLTEVTPESFRVATERVVGALRDRLGEMVSFSVGLALLREGESARGLIGRADKAAYAAKSAGGGTMTLSEE